MQKKYNRSKLYQSSVLTGKNCGQNDADPTIEGLECMTNNSITPRRSFLKVCPLVGDVKHSRASIEKAKKYLNCEPVVSFEEGLKRTVEFYMEHGFGK